MKICYEIRTRDSAFGRFVPPPYRTAFFFAGSQECNYVAFGHTNASVTNKDGIQVYTLRDLNGSLVKLAMSQGNRRVEALGRKAQVEHYSPVRRIGLKVYLIPSSMNCQYLRCYEIRARGRLEYRLAQDVHQH